MKNPAIVSSDVDLFCGDVFSGGGSLIGFDFGFGLSRGGSLIGGGVGIGSGSFPSIGARQ